MAVVISLLVPWKCWSSLAIVNSLSLPGDRTLSKFLTGQKQEGVSCEGYEVFELYRES